MHKFRRNVYKVLEDVKAENDIKQKIDILRANDSHALRDIIRGTYDKTVKWVVSKEPDYKPIPPGRYSANFLILNRELKYFLEGEEYKNLKATKRDSMWRALLEQIHPQDAEMVVNMVNKRPIPGCGRKICDRAFPGLIEEPIEAIRGKKPAKQGEDDAE